MNPGSGQDSIPVSVSPQTAAFFRSLPKGKREKIEAILGQTLEAALKQTEPNTTKAGKSHSALGVQSALLAESALSRLWDSPEEDEAWRDL